jgi:hypothetical protein
MKYWTTIGPIMSGPVLCSHCKHSRCLRVQGGAGSELQILRLLGRFDAWRWGHWVTRKYRDLSAQWWGHCVAGVEPQLCRCDNLDIRKWHTHKHEHFRSSPWPKSPPNSVHIDWTATGILRTTPSVFCVFSVSQNVTRISRHCTSLTNTQAAAYRMLTCVSGATLTEPTPTLRPWNYLWQHSH